MGLDNYLKTEDGELVADCVEICAELKDLQLTGGLFSGHGDNGSFRGKVYNNYVEDVTGESLYQERIDSVTLAKMAEAIRADIKEDGSEHGWDSRHMLAQLFEVGARHGCHLAGWW